jgi:hypothetical protein
MSKQHDDEWDLDDREITYNEKVKRLEELYDRTVKRLKDGDIADVANECAQTTERVKVSIHTRQGAAPLNPTQTPMVSVYVERDVGFGWTFVRNFRKQEFHTFMRAYAFNISLGYIGDDVEG